MKHEHPSTYEVATGPVVVRHSDVGFYGRYGKRVFDLALCAILAVILLPVIAVLAVLVALDGGTPFFGHVRVGKDGKTFRCWKIRTMVVDANERLHSFLAENPEAAAEWERDFKLADDPRVTRLGKFLRKTSLDELPQLLNVLLGEMSFVGPRPVVSDELEKYGAYRTMYMSMRPGVTGLWQVSGRNDVAYNRRVAMDATYSRRFSAAMDVRIIAMTASSVVGMTGK